MDVVARDGCSSVPKGSLRRERHETNTFENDGFRSTRRRTGIAIATCRAVPDMAFVSTHSAVTSAQTRAAVGERGRERCTFLARYLPGDGRIPSFPVLHDEWEELRSASFQRHGGLSLD